MLKKFVHNGNSLILKLASEEDIPVLRKLINAAYKELADLGLNYTATFQDEEITRARMQKGLTFVLWLDQKMIGTILYYIEESRITKKRTAYLEQLAVEPSMKRSGLGSILMDHCENLAKETGYETVQIDTAVPATHLVNWYLQRGYKIIAETRWDNKTYNSYIFEKNLL